MRILAKKWLNPTPKCALRGYESVKRLMNFDVLQKIKHPYYCNQLILLNILMYGVFIKGYFQIK